MYTVVDLHIVYVDSPLFGLFWKNTCKMELVVETSLEAYHTAIHV